MWKRSITLWSSRLMKYLDKSSYHWFKIWKVPDELGLYCCCHFIWLGHISGYFSCIYNSFPLLCNSCNLDNYENRKSTAKDGWNEQEIQIYCYFSFARLDRISTPMPFVKYYILCCMLTRFICLVFIHCSVSKGQL